MFDDINMVELEGEYLRQAGYRLFSESRKRLQVMEEVNASRVLSLFGKTKAGTNPHSLDGLMAGGHTGPTIGASGWYLVCEKPDGQ
ncbi:MAG: hypothetical protein ABSE95_12960 [Thermodesulfobacteriota bacterium]|jgi:hypothetical protein